MTRCFPALRPYWLLGSSPVESKECMLRRHTSSIMPSSNSACGKRSRSFRPLTGSGAVEWNVLPLRHLAFPGKQTEVKRVGSPWFLGGIARERIIDVRCTGVWEVSPPGQLIDDKAGRRGLSQQSGRIEPGCSHALLFSWSHMKLPVHSNFPDLPRGFQSSC